jgi:hypothetical protein
VVQVALLDWSKIQKSSGVALKMCSRNDDVRALMSFGPGCADLPTDAQFADAAPPAPQK